MTIAAWLCQDSKYLLTIVVRWVKLSEALLEHCQHLRLGVGASSSIVPTWFPLTDGTPIIIQGHIWARGAGVTLVT